MAYFSDGFSSSSPYEVNGSDFSFGSYLETSSQLNSGDYVKYNLPDDVNFPSHIEVSWWETSNSNGGGMMALGGFFGDDLIGGIFSNNPGYNYLDGNYEDDIRVRRDNSKFNDPPHSPPGEYEVWVDARIDFNWDNNDGIKYTWSSGGETITYQINDSLSKYSGGLSQIKFAGFHRPSGNPDWKYQTAPTFRWNSFVVGDNVNFTPEASLNITKN
jgi:hypothetical protein